MKHAMNIITASGFDRWFNVGEIFFQQIRQGSKESTGSSDTDSSSDDESMQAAPTGPPEPTDKVQQAKETEAGAEISALVNYVQPVHFNSFENSESEFGWSLGFIWKWCHSMFWLRKFFFVFKQVSSFAEISKLCKTFWASSRTSSLLFFMWHVFWAPH